MPESHRVRSVAEDFNGQSAEVSLEGTHIGDIGRMRIRRADQAVGFAATSFT
jgi:hypothetical protein